MLVQKLLRIEQSTILEIEKLAKKISEKEYVSFSSLVRKLLRIGIKEMNHEYEKRCETFDDMMSDMRVWAKDHPNAHFKYVDYPKMLRLGFEAIDSSSEEVSIMEWTIKLSSFKRVPISSDIDVAWKKYFATRQELSDAEHWLISLVVGQEVKR